MENETPGSEFDRLTNLYSEKINAAARPGFQVAGAKTASALPAPTRGFFQTAEAALSQGITASVFGGFSFDSKAERDSNYDVSADLRPGDERYITQYLLSPNTEETHRLQEYQDIKEFAQGAIGARPGVSFFASLADPLTLGLDVGLYGLGHAVSLPLLVNTARRTRLGIEAANALKNAPRAANALGEAFVGAQAGAASIAAQTEVKVATDILETREGMGKHILIGGALGLALGGGVGLLGKKRTSELVDKFEEANIVSENNAKAPPAGPSKTPDLRMQLAEQEKPKRTPEETKSAAEALKHEAGEGGAAERMNSYDALKANLTQIGENLGKDIHPWVGKAFSLVTAPIRNMSATNRLLSKSFGTARLFAIGMARNATEFLGTRKGFVLPRSAQNRIEDIANHAISISLDMHDIYLRANNIKAGVAAGERLALGETLVSQEDFYAGVGTQLLHVGKATEAGTGASTFVQEAAKVAYEKFYKPYGEILKEYGLIKPDSDISEVLNYLNRNWKTSKLLADPDGFKKWAANFFREQNQKHRTLRPQYEAELKYARQLKRDANRFAKAAERIEKLKAKIEGGDVETKIKEAEKQYAEAVEKSKAAYEEQRKNIEEKYARLKENPDAKVPDISTTKKLLQDEVKQAVQERDDLTKEFNAKEVKLKQELRDIRNDLKAKKIVIKSGNRDSYIIEKVIAEDIENLLRNPAYAGYPLEQITEIARHAAEELDSITLKGLRADLVAQERLEASLRVDEIKAKQVALRQEKKELLAINKSELNKDVAEAVTLLEQEAKESGKQSKTGKINKLLAIREKLEKKLVDLKESHAAFKAEKKRAEQLAKLNESKLELEHLQKKFSYAGLMAFGERKQAEQAIARLVEMGGDAAELKGLVNAAKKRERKSIEELPAVDEAQKVADELLEGHTMALERAEAIIPDELRSATTGKPYRIWSESEEPHYADSIAERTFYTMIGQEDEIVMNSVLGNLGGGTPGILKARTLKMPDDYPGIENWVDRDIRTLLDNFSRGISPAIALTEFMHELNKMPIVQKTVKRMQVLDSKVGAQKALDMPSVMENYNEIPKVMATMMRDEFRMRAEGLEGKELQNLLDEYQAAEKDMATLDKEIKGVMANGLNVNSSTASDVVDLVNSAVSTVTTNNIVISMMSDMMASTMRYGWDKYINKSLAPLLASEEIRALSKRELRALNIANKTGLGSVIKNKITGREGSLKNSAVGKFISNLANRIGNITGANLLDDAMTTGVVVLVKTNLIDMAERVANGKITNKQLTHLAQRGISPEQAKDIYDFWKRYGFEKQGTKGVDPLVLEGMGAADAKAYSDYNNFINDDLKTIIVRPGVGSMPDISYTPVGKSIMFLKKYFFAATNDFLIPGVQRMDRESVQGFTGLFAMGALQSEIRRLYRGEERKEFNLEGFILEALTNSAIPGIYTFGIDLGISAGVLSGMGGARYNPSNGTASLIGGPGVIGFSDRTLGIMGRIRKLVTDEDKQFEYSDWNYFANTAVPLYKWAPISAVAKPRIKEYFESQGRGE